jgi:hypothetical protein
VNNDEKPKCTCESIHKLCEYHINLHNARYAKEYIIESEPTKKFLEDAVNAAITRGYKTTGGITFEAVDVDELREQGNIAWSRNWSGMYSQALIKNRDAE